MSEGSTTAEPVLVDGYVPLVDVSAARGGDDAARRAVARVIDRACRTSGFFAIAGHGIDQAIVQRVLDLSEEFFTLPAATKEQVRADRGDTTLRGLRFSHAQAGGSVAEGSRPPDLCELYTMNRFGEPGADTTGMGDLAERWTKPNRWPDVAGFEEAWLELYGELDELSADLMRLCALALDLPEDHFDPYIDRHVTNLCANYYMPITEAPPPGSFRKGPHSDAGTITILYQDEVGGLEVQNRDGEWVPVRPVAGTFQINLGRLFEIWTNDRWVSTPHRIKVPAPEHWSQHRISLPFFHHPNWDAVIECLPSCQGPDDPPRHEPVRSGEFLEHGLGYLVSGD